MSSNVFNDGESLHNSFFMKTSLIFLIFLEKLAWDSVAHGNPFDFLSRKMSERKMLTWLTMLKASLLVKLTPPVRNVSVCGILIKSVITDCHGFMGPRLSTCKWALLVRITRFALFICEIWNSYSPAHSTSRNFDLKLLWGLIWGGEVVHKNEYSCSLFFLCSTFCCDLNFLKLTRVSVVHVSVSPSFSVSHVNAFDHSFFIWETCDGHYCYTEWDKLCHVLVYMVRDGLPIPP